MTIERPAPVPDPVSAGFWAASAKGELAIQRCAACHRFQHPPRALCRACGGAALAFETVSGQARLASWTTTHHNLVAGFAPALPYTCLVVELVEQPGLFLLSDLVGRDDPAALRLGAPMHAIFPDQDATGIVLPQFAPGSGAPR
ncbi:MAG: hypothetical protein NVSMB18_21560 [Acetobacteraceae bacterium]